MSTAEPAVGDGPDEERQVAWLVRQVDGYAEAHLGPLPSAQLDLSAVVRRRT